MTAALSLQEAFTAFEKGPLPGDRVHAGPVHWRRVDMIAACDLRYGTTDAWLRIEETNIGMRPMSARCSACPKLIPSGVALELAYTGENLTAERALRAGAAQRCRTGRNGPEGACGRRGAAYRIETATDHFRHQALTHLLCARPFGGRQSRTCDDTGRRPSGNPADIIEAFAARTEKRDGHVPHTADASKTARLQDIKIQGKFPP